MPMMQIRWHPTHNSSACLRRLKTACGTSPLRHPFDLHHLAKSTRSSSYSIISNYSFDMHSRLLNLRRLANSGLEPASPYSVVAYASRCKGTPGAKSPEPMPNSLPSVNASSFPGVPGLELWPSLCQQVGSSGYHSFTT